MALSALWRRSVSWRSALTRLVQLFCSPQSSGTKGSANLPPPAPLASSPGAAVPSSTAQGGPQGSGKPLAGADQRAPQGQLQPYDHQGRAVAPVPPARHSPASSANPSGTPLGSGSPPDRSTPMDVDVTPALNISLASDVSMEEDAPRGCDLSLATDVSMEEDTARGCGCDLARCPPTSPWRRTPPEAATSRWPVMSPWRRTPPRPGTPPPAPQPHSSSKPSGSLG
ncbi:basic proline-rich protein-like [Pipra filicauda]|uniref:Basic proline-rich protein-like n=1 Tax=Pipra filicauda TaxID=649802 RepID=A0A7R5KY92_9PASS|nr:basic proline-rich protein-like [Pipra filicauda]